MSSRPNRGAIICVDGERRRAPGAEAARARDELADRPLEARAGRLLVLAGVGIALDERLAHEARRPSSLESVREALKVAAPSTAKSSAVSAAGRGRERGDARPGEPAAKVPAIVA